MTSADKDQSLLNFHGLLPEETAKEAAVQILRSADAECSERECVPACRMKLQSFVSLSLKFHMEMLTPVNGKSPVYRPESDDLKGDKMGNNRNGSRKRIETICASRKINESEVYGRARKLLEVYRDVCWETSEYADLVREDLTYEYGYASGDLDTALMYLENFAPDEQREKFTAKIQSLFSIKWMVEIVDSAIIKVREFPLNGELYAHILSLYYLGRFQYSETEMMEELNLERSSYYRRKKEAMIVFGLAIWGGTLENFRRIMIGNEDQILHDTETKRIMNEFVEEERDGD